MNFNLNKQIVLLVTLLSFTSLFSQSSSVFNASYFNKQDGSAPPILVGKGFHIEDMYRQTKSCFTQESSNVSKLVSQQSTGTKTELKIIYAHNSEQYNNFIKNGSSGKIGFLNLFSAGGSKLKEYTSHESNSNEKLIFNYNIDFGYFSYPADPKLNIEAKALIDNNKFNDFINFYGNHYISGIKKESSINIILTKGNSKTSQDIEENSGSHLGANTPSNVNFNFETINENKANEELNNYEFTFEIIVNGPPLTENTLQESIKEIISGEATDKVSAIMNVVKSAAQAMNDPKKSIITQYYYSPFTLYGVNNNLINWDETKQEKLTNINENAINVFAAKTEVENFLSDDYKNEFITEINSIGIAQKYSEILLKKYEDVVPNFKEISLKSEYFLQKLEESYKTCYSIKCSKDSICCNEKNTLLEIKNYNVQKKYEDEIAKFTSSLSELFNNPECELYEKGIISIKNTSYNPYYIYANGELLFTIDGRTTQKILRPIGSHNIKAVQKSGYLMYPTENYKTVTISNLCEEISIIVGY